MQKETHVGRRAGILPAGAGAYTPSANQRLETTAEYLDVLTELQITRVRMPETTLFLQGDD